jgi:hypothetical protein
MTNDKPTIGPIGNDYTIMPTKLAEALNALVPLADAVLDHADSHCRWFDISTAPKDGTEFYAAKHGEYPITVYYQTPFANIPDRIWMCDAEGGAFHKNAFDVWKPIDAPSNPPLPAVFVDLGQALEKIKEGR